MPNTIPNDIKIIIAISSSSKSSKRESMSEISQFKLCENKVAIHYVLAICVNCRGYKNFPLLSNITYLSQWVLVL